MAKGAKKKPSTDDRPVAPAPAAAPAGIVESVGELGAATVRALQALLPAGRAPLALLGAGLLVVGAVELPVVVAAGLAYEALRRWQTPPPASGSV